MHIIKKKWAVAKFDDLEELECSEHAKNLINQQLTIFYIETISHFFFQLRKKIFFRNIFFLRKSWFSIKISENQRKSMGFLCFSLILIKNHEKSIFFSKQMNSLVRLRRWGGRFLSKKNGFSKKSKRSNFFARRS